MTDEEIYDLVHTVINTVTGIATDHIIPADDNEESPDNAYASIKVGVRRGQRGQANITKSNTDLVSSPIGDVYDVNHNIKAQINVDVSINFYRTNAIENALNLFQANKRPDISDLLFTANIGWKGTGAVNDLTALQSKEREERSQVTLTLLYEQEQSMVTNAIYGVPIIVEYEDGDVIITDDPIPFLPSDLINLTAWFRFNKGITVTGAGVSQWDDASGNDNHLLQATDTNRPSKEVDGSILFDGVDNFLKTQVFALHQPCTVYLLVKQVSWSAPDALYDGNELITGAVLQTAPSPGIAANGLAALNLDLLVGVYGALATVFNGVLSSIKVNNGVETTGDTGISPMDGFTLGAAATAVLHSNIQVKEVVIYSGAHDEATRVQMADYLNSL